MILYSGSCRDSDCTARQMTRIIYKVRYVHFYEPDRVVERTVYAHYLTTSALLVHTRLVLQLACRFLKNEEEAKKISQQTASLS